MFLQTDTTEADYLRRSATRVRQGWSKGQYMDAQRNVCAIGAMADVVGALVEAGRVDFSARLDRLSGLVEEQLLHEGYRSAGLPLIPHWNDHTATSAEDVARLFERTADRLEGK